jgi:2,4-dienoyl-CoA reductase-like NADH-dependent reductase (Old Yellow Enzyme family)
MFEPSRTISTKPTDVLFISNTLGDLQLKNRIVMAPLTRCSRVRKAACP